jgi:hypothetical protein
MSAKLVAIFLFGVGLLPEVAHLQCGWGRSFSMTNLYFAGCTLGKYSRCTSNQA